MNGAPLLYIFAPMDVPQEYLDNFRQWTKEAGFPDLYLVGNIPSPKIKKEELLKRGYDAVTYQRLGGLTNKTLSNMGRYGRFIYKYAEKIKGFLLHQPPFKTDYKKYLKYLVTDEDKERNVIPCIIPQWDHTPRSGWNGSFFVNVKPEYFYENAKHALEAVKNKPEQEQLIFLKSWNEWGEGNMMEPDLTFGRGFIEALRKAVDEAEKE